MPKPDVYIIDPRSDLRGSLAMVRERSSDTGYVYYPHSKNQHELARILDDERSSLKLLPFEGINSDIDDELFGFCQKIASNAARGVPERPLRWPFFVLLQERLTLEVRKAEHLRYMLRNKEYGQIFWVSTTVRPAHCRSTIFAAFPDAVDISGLFYAPMSNAILRFSGNQRTALISEEGLSKVARVRSKRRTVCVSSNLDDPRYCDSILPVVKQLLERHNVILLPTRAGEHQASFKRFGIENHPNLLFLNKSKAVVAPNSGMETASRIIRSSERITEDPYEAIYAGAVRDLVAELGFTFLAQSRMLLPQVARIAKASDLVLVSPGRPHRSTMMVAAAQIVGVPSVELQSGTLTRNRRFVRPIADKLLLIDEASRECFAYLGRTKDVEVIGGTKIDHELAPYREMSVSEARKQVGFPENERLWMLATQPVGVDRMDRIARIVVSAARQSNACILLKMHPNENQLYESVYKRIAAEFPEVKIKIDRVIRAALASKAADVVFTHYSTVGIEAHILGKLSIVVNPEDGRPIFDLVGMGVAHEAKNAEAILSLVQGTKPLPMSSSTLTDGKSVERAIAIIDEMIRGGRSKSNARADRAIAKVLDTNEPEETLSTRLRRYYSHLPLPVKRALSPAVRRTRELLKR